MMKQLEMNFRNSFCRLSVFVVSSSEFNCQSYSQQWWHNETGTGTEYASFIFTITLQQIYPAFSASKIIIKIFGTFCQSTVLRFLWTTTTASPLRRCIFAAAIFEIFAKKGLPMCSQLRSPRCCGVWWLTRGSSEEKMAPASWHSGAGAGPSEADDLQTHKEWY